MILKRNFVTAFFLAVAMVLTAICTPAHSAAKVLKMSSFMTKTSAIMQPVQEMCNNIEKYTNGTVKVKFYGVDEIAGVKDMPALLRRGSLDFMVSAPVYYQTLFPINAALQQLALLNKGPEQAQYCWRALFREFPELQNEFAAQNAYLLDRASLGTFYTLSKKPLQGVADMKGMKMRSFGGKLAAEYLNAAGATPVFVPPADSYESLMRGVYDAYIGDMPTMMSYKLYENAKHLGMPAGALIGWFIAVNMDSWKQLTPSEQQAITRAVTEWTNKDLAMNVGYDINYLKQLEEKGVKYIAFPQKEYAAIYEKFGDPWEKLKQVMKEDLKIDPVFTEKFVNRYKQLNSEYDTKYLKTGKKWTYQ